MRKKVVTICLCVLWGAFGLAAQNVPGALANAFKSGNAKELSFYFSEKVDMALADGSKEYSKEEAGKLMTDFFSANKVNDFTVNHHGKRNESSFIVGTLSTSSGNYRINCFFKKMGDKFLIHQIRIDKNNE